TFSGTLAASLFLLLNATTAPPSGASAVSVTVPVAEDCPSTTPGLIPSDSSTAGTTTGGVGVGVGVGVGAGVGAGVGVGWVTGSSPQPATTDRLIHSTARNRQPLIMPSPSQECLPGPETGPG